MQPQRRAPFGAVLMATTLWVGMAGLAGTGLGAQAAETQSAPEENARSSDFRAGQRAVERKDWSAAVASFRKVVAQEPNNADALNMLAYSYRWQGKMDEAFANYERALKIDPNHRGALEYQGVAFVRTGQMAKAEANLARLEQIAGRNGEEYRDLARAIAEAKARK